MSDPGAPDERETVPTSDRDPAIARRRAILYALGGVLLIAVVVYAITGVRSSSEKKSELAPLTPTPVIVARIRMSAVAGEAGRGLGEMLDRNHEESLRVLASRLKPNKDDEAYQLVLAGGPRGERLLGSAVVGAPRVFVGEAKITFKEIERYRRLELRRVTRGENPTAKLVLRGRIPR